MEVFVTWVYASSIRHGGKLFLESEYTANLGKTNAEIEIIKLKLTCRISIFFLTGFIYLKFIFDRFFSENLCPF